MKTHLAVLIFIAALSGASLQAALKFPNITLPGRSPSQPAPSEPALVTSAPGGSTQALTEVPKYDESNPPQLSMDETITRSRSVLKDAKDTRGLKDEVQRLLREAATGIHVAAQLQQKICAGLNRYLKSLETIAAVELDQELSYSSLAFRLSQGVNTNSSVTDLKTVITADLQGSQISAAKISEQLNGFQTRREAIKAKASEYYELFRKANASLLIVDHNYRHALLTGEITAEAMGKKLDDLQAKAIAQTTINAALIGALIYYSADAQKKINSSGNNLRGLGERLKWEASLRLIQEQTRSMQNTQREFEDMKAYAQQARPLIESIYAQGPALRQQNQQITKLLDQTAQVAKDSAQVRAETDAEVKTFKDHDIKVQALVANNQIPVFAE